MLTRPGLATLRKPGPTAVKCACGEVLCRLQPGEAVYPAGTLMRAMGATTKRKEQCPKCGAECTFQVTTTA
jgi:hypothetical protein